MTRTAKTSGQQGCQVDPQVDLGVCLSALTSLQAAAPRQLHAPCRAVSKGMSRHSDTSLLSWPVPHADVDSWSVFRCSIPQYLPSKSAGAFGWLPWPRCHPLHSLFFHASHVPPLRVAESWPHQTERLKASTVGQSCSLRTMRRNRRNVARSPFLPAGRRSLKLPFRSCEVQTWSFPCADIGICTPVPALRMSCPLDAFGRPCFACFVPDAVRAPASVRRDLHVLGPGHTTSLLPRSGCAALCKFAS